MGAYAEIYCANKSLNRNTKAACADIGMPGIIIKRAGDDLNIPNLRTYCFIILKVFSREFCFNARI